MELRIGSPLHAPKEPRESFVVRVVTDGEYEDYKDTEIGPYIEGHDEAELEALLKLLQAMQDASHEFQCLRYDDPRKQQPFYFARYVKDFPSYFVYRSEEKWKEYCHETGATQTWSEYEQLSAKAGKKSMYWPEVRDYEGDQHIYTITVIYIDAKGIERLVDWNL